MRNVNMETLDSYDVADVAALTIDVLAQMDAELAAAEARLKARRDVFRKGVVAKYGQNTLGTVNVPDGSYTVKVETPKNVSWDQARLAALWDEIGASAGEYIERKLSVSETKYKSWPENIRAEFEPARTVKPGATKVTFVKREAA